MKNTILALSLFFAACAPPPPPEYFVIDEEFEEWEAATIREAFASWCEKVGYCPTEAMWADRGRVILVPDLPEDDYTRRVCPEAGTCTTNGTNDGRDVVLIAANRVYHDDVVALWWAAAHEIGHYCTEHTETGLMAAVSPLERAPVIDDVAAEAWRQGCAGR